MSKINAYVLVSGGPDSTTLSHDIAKQRTDLSCLFVNFGQPFLDRELLAARIIAQRLGTPITEVNIAGLRHSLVGLGEKGEHVIMRDVAEATYGVAVAYIRHHGGNTLYHANISEDLEDIPNLDKFLPALQRAINLIPGAEQLKIESPYIHLKKKRVFERAKSFRSASGAYMELSATWISSLRRM